MMSWLDDVARILEECFVDTLRMICAPVQDVLAVYHCRCHFSCGLLVTVRTNMVPAAQSSGVRLKVLMTWNWLLLDTPAMHGIFSRAHLDFRALHHQNTCLSSPDVQVKTVFLCYILVSDVVVISK